VKDSRPNFILKIKKLKKKLAIIICGYRSLSQLPKRTKEQNGSEYTCIHVSEEGTAETVLANLGHRISIV
jgi:hypothetical protein